jgi:hypothetical protein
MIDLKYDFRPKFNVFGNHFSQKIDSIISVLLVKGVHVLIL